MTDEKKRDLLACNGLTKPQKSFLEYCEEFGWGIVEVEIKSGQPVMVSPVVRDGVVQHKTKLD